MGKRIIKGDNHYKDHIIRQMPIRTDYVPTKKTCQHSKGDWLDKLGPIDFEKVIREAPERLKRIKDFEQKMDDQMKIDPEVMWWTFTI